MEQLTPYGAATIIRTGRNYIVEEKTPGYPHDRMVGGICLIGGIGDPEKHENFTDTVQTEFREEFRKMPELAEVLIENLEFYQGFRVRTPRQYINSPIDNGDHVLTYAIFESVLPEDAAREFGIKRHYVLGNEEGIITVYDEDDLHTLQFIWGGDKIVEKYLKELGKERRLMNRLPGLTVSEIDINPKLPYSIM